MNVALHPQNEWWVQNNSYIKIKQKFWGQGKDINYLIIKFKITKV